jgi:hypothetical protein
MKVDIIDLNFLWRYSLNEKINQEYMHVLYTTVINYNTSSTYGIVGNQASLFGSMALLIEQMTMTESNIREFESALEKVLNSRLGADI